MKTLQWNHIQELIPHVDAAYRTVAQRDGRALDGFSMGGFGAAHLGFEYPEVFGVVSIMAPRPRAAAETSESWERLSDGSMGRETEFRGVGGVAIPAYIRRPDGPGPFPVVVLLHGGRHGKAAMLGMGRSMQPPVGDFLRAGWAVYSIPDNGPHGFYFGPPDIPEYREAARLAVAFFERQFGTTGAARLRTARAR